MEKDQEIIQWLNLVHMSPIFVIRVGRKDESPSVSSPKTIPKNDGEYWVAGETILKNGQKIASVFRVDTNTGGSLISVYWRIESQWWNFKDRPNVFDALNIAEEEAFPFDWGFSVKMDEDIYHS